MVAVTLPDGSKREFDAPVRVLDVAQSIGSGLAKAALAGMVDGRMVDTSFLIERDSQLAIITDKSPEALDIVRHSTAHLLAYAVKELFPEAQVTIGPVIENGFYYDFSFHRPFTPDDLTALEKRMAELAKKDEPVTRTVMPRDAAVQFFKDQGEHYKAEIIASIPQGEDVSLYTEGKFTDLCRGPHVPSTGKLKVFKLMKLAGAYWRGDSKNEMLQRIYGTYMRKVYQDEGYHEVKAPQILDRGLWEKSGHWENYKENMFTTESENRSYALKPMNCPGHVQIFNSGLHSYRELPLRYGEFGQCHRNEPSGALHGLMRVRGFTQDDGHIFCTEDQIQSEVASFDKAVRAVYADFGFSEVDVKLALRPLKRVGDDAIWDKAEEALRGALRASGQTWEELPGEGAFYGPKIEYHLKDSIGRSWQCGTMQVDFSMPARLGAEYVAEDNTRKVPVMLHRAIVGSLERFIGILIENHAGNMPVWLAPTQAVVLNISENSAAYAQQIQQLLKKQGFRVDADLRNEKITYKIREHALQKLPYLLVVGDKERESNTVAVRARGGVDLGVMPLDAFVARLQQDISQKVGPELN